MSVDKRQESALQMPESRDRFIQIMEIKNQYIADLEKLSGKKSSDLSPDEKILVKNASEFAKVLQEQNIQKEVYTQQAQELLDALKRSISETQAVKESTGSALDDIKPVVVTSQPVVTVDLTQDSPVSPKPGQKNKLQNIPTGEKNSEFWGTFSGDTNRSEYYDKNPQIRVSLGDYFRGKSKSDMMALKDSLYTELIKLKGDKITPLNNGALIEILEKAGYKFNNVFKSEEIVNFYHTLNNMLQAQDKITSSSIEKDTIKILLDNGDGLLEAGNGEAANLFHTVEALHLNEKKGDGFGALIENLGLGNKEDFFTSMGENLYSARERFRRAFDAMNGRYTITELVKKGKLQQSTAEILREHQDFEKAFEQKLQTFFAANIDKNNNLIQVAPEVKEKFKQDFKNKFNIQSLSFSHVNGGVGLGAGVNIQELTSGVLDSLSVGLTDDGNLGLSVNKGLFTEVLSKYGSSVVVGISHTLSPFLGISQKLSGQAYTSQELFELSRERTIGTTVSGSVSAGAKVLSVNFSRIDHNTSSGIEQMSVGMEKLLTEEVARDILLGKAEYSKEGATPREQEVYGQMKSAFDTATSGMDAKEKQDFMKIFIHSYVNAYRNELYRNAEGMKLTSFGIGVISIEGFYNLPFLTLGGEKISTQKREVQKDYERQEKITHTGIDLRKVGGKIVTQNGHQVLELPTEFTSDKLEGTKGEMQISVSSKSQSQIKIENGNIYIGGEISLENIALVEQTEQGTLTRTLVIDGGVKDKNGTYISSYEQVDAIDKGLRIQTGTEPVSEKLVGLHMEQEAGVKDISAKLTQIISFDALKDKDTPGMTQLQKDIFTFRQNGTPALEDVWNSYMKVIGDKKFINYAIKGEKINRENFLSFVNENKQISDDTHKIYILQALAMGLTSKGKLVASGDTYKVEGGKKTISEYNTAHNRDAYFDTMMAKEVPSLASDITTARNEWNNKFGELKSYPKFTRETGLALSGTQVGKETGLTPLSDRYDLIGSESDLIKIENLDNKKKTELVNKIPTYVLEGYLKQLQQLGVSVNGIQGVKNFIINGGIEKVKINMDVFFAKNAQCINDAIIIDIKVTKDGEEIPLVIGAAATSSSFVQENNTLSFGVVGAGRLEEIENESSETTEDEKSQTVEDEKSTTEVEAEKSTTETEPESSTTQNEPEGSETVEDEKSTTEVEAENSTTVVETEASTTEVEAENSTTVVETEPESSLTETEPEGSQTISRPPQIDE